MLIRKNIISYMGADTSRICDVLMKNLAISFYNLWDSTRKFSYETLRDLTILHFVRPGNEKSQKFHTNTRNFRLSAYDLWRLPE